MLPNLAGLALEAHKAAPTAEFYTLSEEEVVALKKEKNNEIYSQDTPEANNKDMFRIANTRKAQPGAVNDHSWSDGLQLWAWAEGHELDPLRKPWWHEDWMALRNRYDPQFPPPEWVQRLPRLLSDAGRAAVDRKLSAGDYARYPSGPDNLRPEWPDFEDSVTWVRDEPSSGWDLYVDGTQRYKVWDAHGVVYYYEGSKGEERKVKEAHPGGQINFYEGPKGEEHLVRVEANNVVILYAGPRGEEFLVQARNPNGTLIFYDGLKGEEHLVRFEVPNGETVFLEGPKGEERRVKLVLPDGTVEFYEGLRDEEHLVRVEFPDGEVMMYDGPKGEERLVGGFYGGKIFYSPRA